jgi:endonuclease/exonuclease/phosphatase (EEP) superfamily protein YafD
MSDIDPSSQLETHCTNRIFSNKVVWLLKAGVVTTGLIPIAIFLLSLLAPYLYWGEMLINFRLQIAILMLVGNGLLLSMRKFWLSLGYFLLVIFAGWKVLSIYLPAAQPTPGESKLLVMTFNLFNMNTNPIEDVQIIYDWNADILLLTEYTSQWCNQLQSLKLRYPYALECPRWHGYGIAMFSKFPLSNQRVLNLTGSTDVPMLLATAEVGQYKLQLIGVHTISPVTVDRMKIRNEQLKTISKYVPDSREPVVLLGDLNCVPWSTFMAPLNQKGLRDSRQGFGFHPTWNRAFGPFKIPIDHCYVSDSIHVHDRVVGSSYGSDHFPVITTISIANQPQVDGIE